MKKCLSLMLALVMVFGLAACGAKPAETQPATAAPSVQPVTDAMKGMLAPKFREVSLGELQVRQVYKISNVGTVAGCRVTSGKITRDSQVRVVRDGIVIAEDEIASLKRFKDDAKEVAEGYECGVTLEKFADVKEGDVYEAFKMEEYRD